MGNEGVRAHPERWLLENGPKELELLFRAVVCHPSAPILIADNDRIYRDASPGAARLLGLSRKQIIGRQLDDFAQPSFKPRVSQLWRAFLEQGEQKGVLRLVGPDGCRREVAYTAKGNVLPLRNLLVLSDKGAEDESVEAGADEAPAWVRDFALFLLDVGGRVAAWYAGAERIYSYKRDEAIGRHVSFLYPNHETLDVAASEELKRAAAAGHFGNEGWHMRQDGSRFWANTITMALNDEGGELQGFARIVRDFSERHERDEKLRRSRERIRPIPVESTIAGIVSGEFDQIPEANDAFLELVGYSREDLDSGLLRWPDLTPTGILRAR